MKRSRVTFAITEAAAIVDPADAARGDGDARGRAQHARIELLAHLGRVLLGVVERGERAQVRERQPLVVEQHGRRHERAGEAAAARLVGPGDEADAEPAVEPEEAAAGGALALR